MCSRFDSYVKDRPGDRACRYADAAAVYVEHLGKARAKTARRGDVAIR